MPDEPKHIVSSFEADLKKLRDMITTMGGLVERAVADAAVALLNRDQEVATKVIESDAEIDTEQHNVEQFAVRLLALLGRRRA